MVGPPQIPEHAGLGSTSLPAAHTHGIDVRVNLLSALRVMDTEPVFGAKHQCRAISMLMDLWFKNKTASSKGIWTTE